MMKLLMGFAAGYWVASRRAAGQSVVPPEAGALAAKYANDAARLVSAAADPSDDEGGERPMVRTVQQLQGYRRR